MNGKVKIAEDGRPLFTVRTPGIGNKIQQNALRLFWEELRERYGVEPSEYGKAGQILVTKLALAPGRTFTFYNGGYDEAE